jgi:hypothetical protein
VRISVAGITEQYRSSEITSAAVADYFRCPPVTTGLKRHFLGNLSAFTVAYRLLSAPSLPQRRLRGKTLCDLVAMQKLVSEHPFPYGEEPMIKWWGTCSEH